MDHYLPVAGEFIEWEVDASAARSMQSPILPSFNQSIHLDAAETSHTWLAGTFELPGRIDREALGRAFHDLIARHGTLHSSFVRGPAGIERHC
ncbi:peptide synthase, partial [Mycobacterium tuberculosis]|nr:peptide synthase [Mycobacterium tuberculosis]